MHAKTILMLMCLGALAGCGGSSKNGEGQNITSIKFGSGSNYRQSSTMSVRMREQPQSQPQTDNNTPNPNPSPNPNPTPNPTPTLDPTPDPNPDPTPNPPPTPEPPKPTPTNGCEKATDTNPASGKACDALSLKNLPYRKTGKSKIFPTTWAATSPTSGAMWSLWKTTM